MEVLSAVLRRLGTGEAESTPSPLKLSSLSCSPHTYFPPVSGTGPDWLPALEAVPVMALLWFWQAHTIPAESESPPARENKTLT